MWDLVTSVPMFIFWPITVQVYVRLASNRYDCVFLCSIAVVSYFHDCFMINEPPVETGWSEKKQYQDGAWVKGDLR